MSFGYDDNGLFRLLPDGRVLRVHKEIYNYRITLSESREDQGWSHGW